MNDLFEFLRFGEAALMPLFAAACAVAMLVKCRASLSGILGGIGFGLVFIFAAIRSLNFFWDLFLWGRHEGVFFALAFSQWVAWVCIVVALFALPRSRQGATATASGSPPPILHGAYAVDPRPGWGLATGWIVCSALAWVAGLIYFGLWLDAMPRVSNREMEEMLPALFAALLLGIPAMILWCMWLYRAWSAVPERHRSATPGQAVGFLFIPFFNLYWVFRAIPGLSASIRRATWEVAPNRASSASYGLGIAAAIVALIPYVSVIVWILFLLWLILANVEKNRMLRLRAGYGAQDSFTAPYGSPPPVENEYPEGADRLPPV